MRTVLDRTDKKILKSCAEPGPLQPLYEGKGAIPRATVFRRAQELRELRLLEKTGRNTYHTTAAGMEVVGKGGTPEMSRLSGKGGARMPNAYLLLERLEEYGPLKQLCEEFDIGPQDLTELLKMWKALCDRGLDPEDLQSVLDTAEKLNADVGQVILDVGCQAQLGEVRVALDEAKSEESKVLAEVDEARRALEHTELDPLELEKLSEFKHELDRAGVPVGSVRVFLHAQEELSKHVEWGVMDLSHCVWRVAESLARVCAEKGIEPIDAIDWLADTIEEGVKLEELRQQREAEEQRLRELQSQKEDTLTSLKELQAELARLAQERDELLATKEAVREEMAKLPCKTAAEGQGDGLPQ